MFLETVSSLSCLFCKVDNQVAVSICGTEIVPEIVIADLVCSLSYEIDLILDLYRLGSSNLLIISTRCCLFTGGRLAIYR